MRILLLGVFLGVAGAPVFAQAPTPSVAAPGLSITGVAFGSFNVRTDSAARASLGGKRPTAFSIDRIYVNFRAPAGDNGAFRFTTDIFQNTNTTTNGYYQGWTVRMKYAWFEYTMARDALGPGSSVLARVGSINNIVIDPNSGAWPRYFSPLAVERVPYFSSADIGAGVVLTLPNRMGDIYANVTNGSGYASYDRDRFKDPAIKMTLTPLANRPGYFQALYMMPWYYKGYVGSRFASGGTGQIGPGERGAVTEALTRDRYGFLVGVRDRRLNFATEIAWQRDESEGGDNTAASPRAVADSTGRLINGFAVVRPVELFNSGKRSPFLLVARYDHLTPNINPQAAEYAGTKPSYAYTLLGAAYELNQRITVALDWQRDQPTGFPPAVGSNIRPRTAVSTYFAHWNVTF